MILNLDDNYRIKTDPYNFTLEKKRVSKNGNKQRWSLVGHFPTIERVLKDVRDEKIKDLDVHTLDELDRQLNTLSQDLKAIGERCVAVWGRD